MKQLIIFAIVFTFLSCGNPKAEIVEQIKSFNDSLAVVGMEENDLHMAMNEVRRKYTGQQALDSVYALEMRQTKRKAELFVKRINFQSKIDSLELELKKY